MIRHVDRLIALCAMLLSGLASARCVPAAEPTLPVDFRHAGVIAAWEAYADRLTFGRGQTLALLDDGCDLSKPEWSLSDGDDPKILVTYDAVDGDDDPKHEGRGYHGTTIGIPSSVNYNGKRGVAFNDQLAVVRSLECCHCNLSDAVPLARALQWVIDHHQRRRITTINPRAGRRPGARGAGRDGHRRQARTASRTRHLGQRAHRQSRLHRRHLVARLAAQLLCDRRGRPRQRPSAPGPARQGRAGRTRSGDVIIERPGLRRGDRTPGSDRKVQLRLVAGRQDAAGRHAGHHAADRRGGRRSRYRIDVSADRSESGAGPGVSGDAVKFGLSGPRVSPQRHEEHQEFSTKVLCDLGDFVVHFCFNRRQPRSVSHTSIISLTAVLLPKTNRLSPA